MSYHYSSRIIKYSLLTIKYKYYRHEILLLFNKGKQELSAWGSGHQVCGEKKY